MNLEEASFEQLDGDLIVKELCRELQIDANDLLNKLDELNLDSWDYLELVDAYEAEGYDIKDILDDYEFDELKVNLNEGKFKEQDIENQENADTTEQGDIHNKKKSFRKELALARGKDYVTPKRNKLIISVLTYDINTINKQGEIYIGGYILKNDLSRQEFKCHSAEEFCDVYLNN